MGKKKIALIDLSQSQKAEYKAGGTRDQRIRKKKEKIAETSPQPIAPKPLKKAKTKLKAKKEKTTKKRVKHPRSNRYLTAKKLVDKTKAYSIKEALKLLRQVSQVKFDATIELHCNLTVKKLTGELDLPHGSGKTQKVEIASNSTLAKLKDNKIDFDVLVAAPAMMPQLAKYAKLLGPKGLMPNPKTNTISDKPEELKKKLAGGITRFKSEPKAPLIHLSIGKLSFKDTQLEENINTTLKTIALTNLHSVYLCSSMSPSIKLQV